MKVICAAQARVQERRPEQIHTHTHTRARRPLRLLVEPRVVHEGDLRRANAHSHADARARVSFGRAVAPARAGRRDFL